MSIELWGGIECSRVHLRDRTVDQLDLTGHAARKSDISLLASLSVEAVRYPVLLSRVAPDGVLTADWSWPDERLLLLRKNGIRPIVTLVHHGTRYRNLDVRDPGYAVAVAEYAGAVAHRYPWVRDYTPINEPLTTARFSCLYGFWYPHQAHEPYFYRTLVNLCRATTLSMQAVRAVNPAARLIHTEDLGWTHSTAELAYQADFENGRRWLGLDLLCGRVTDNHEFFDRLLHAGITRPELDWFVHNPCPPAVLGCDYYPTSERVIDQRLDLYPEWSHGGNDHMEYADIHVDMAPEFEPRTFEQLLLEAWERLGLPLALTEVHLDAPVEDQVSWLNEAWQIAQRLQDSNISVEAVCAWALFGSFDWNSLMTRQEGHYEAGAFDLTSGKPKITELGSAIQQLSKRALAVSALR